MAEGEKLTINIVANAALGPGLSGGDRIFIECARRWAAQGHTVNLFVWEEGYDMCRRNRLDHVNYVVWPMGRFRRLGFPVHYLWRTIKGSLAALRYSSEAQNLVIYSASDFWPDSIPGFLMKWRAKKALWIGSLFLFAPNPLKGFRDAYRAGWRLPSLSTLFYYLHQKPIDWLISRYAGLIFVTNELDRGPYLERGIEPSRVMAVQGGVDTKKIAAVPATGESRYEGAFVGRFHPQKGVLELVDVWGKVTAAKKDARLVMIGDGPLEAEVRRQVARRGLSSNIDLLGFLDGDEKIKILKSSSVFLHPAVYDSGGMAACEGMACGLPAVGFDLPALRTYYPRGMLKAPVGDTQRFADLISHLLDDPVLYQKVQQEATSLSAEWDWDKRADEIMQAVSAASQRPRGVRRTPTRRAPSAGERSTESYLRGDYQFQALTAGNVVQRTWHRNKLALAEAVFPICRDDVVLDAGCGSGNFVFAFGPRCRRIYGVDINPQALAFARNKSGLPNCCFTVASLKSLPFQDNAVSKIFCIDALKHFSPGDAAVVLREFHRVLRPGGKLLIVAPNGRSPWPLIEGLMKSRRLWPRTLENVHLANWSLESIKRVSNQAGFEVESAGSFSHFSPFLAVVGARTARWLFTQEVRFGGGWGNMLYVSAAKTVISSRLEHAEEPF